MHEDYHQGDGVWRQVLQLEFIRLQQHEEEEGGEQEHQPDKSVGSEVHKLIRPQAGERVIPCRTLSLYPPACQPINFLSFLMSSGDRRREDKRVDAIAAVEVGIRTKQRAQVQR
jgi:hypothetical protein